MAWVMARSEDQDVGVCHTPSILLINPNKLHDLQKQEEMKLIFSWFRLVLRFNAAQSPILLPAADL